MAYFIFKVVRSFKTHELLFAIAAHLGVYAKVTLATRHREWPIIAFVPLNTIHWFSFPGSKQGDLVIPKQLDRVFGWTLLQPWRTLFTFLHDSLKALVPYITKSCFSAPISKSITILITLGLGLASSPSSHAWMISSAFEVINSALKFIQAFTPHKVSKISQWQAFN